MSPVDRDSEFESLLEYLKRSRGFDFTGYKRPSLYRRIRKRMQAVGIDSPEEYALHVEQTPEEVALLFNTILINVTDFFRDTQTWDALRHDIVPKLLEQRSDAGPVRVWSAGCASGEEAYSLAMLLADVMGEDGFRDRVKVYATDLDEEALAYARQAVYTARQVEGVPADLLERYFERAESRYAFRKDLRRSVIFGRNDLVRDSPISRIDLLVCRNTLMYFTAEAQAKVLARLHFALNESGFLVLGRAETMFAHPSYFVPVDLKRRIFAKVPRATLRDRLAPVADPARLLTEDPDAMTEKLREAAFENGIVPQLVVDRQGALVFASAAARSLFGIAQEDFGRPFQDFEVSYRPMELRGPIETAYSERRSVALDDVRWTAPGNEERWFTIHVAPIDLSGKGHAGMSISFLDVTLTRQLQRELEHSHHELETAYEELQSANEELETTNEELHSTVAELETTNEELQSTNEELETMNEELQSTNEELQTMNDELRQSGEQLDSVNIFLESVFTSLGGGIVVLDRDRKVLVWNRRAEDLWGLRSEEVMRTAFFDLDIGLPLEPLQTPVKRVISGQSLHEHAELSATNRRGRQFTCEVRCTPLRSNASDEIRGVILFMEEIEKD